MVNNRKTYFAIYYQLHRDKVLKRSIEYYENNKSKINKKIYEKKKDKKLKQRFVSMEHNLKIIFD